MSTDADTGSSTDQYDWEDVTYNAPSLITTSNNATAAKTATVVTAPALASCDVCLNAPRVTMPYYLVDMQLFVSNVSTHSLPPILIVLCVDVPYLLLFGFTISCGIVLMFS